MHYRAGDIVLVKFPFTTLRKSKKRPVLVMKDENALGDIVCFQITSKSTGEFLFPLEDTHFVENPLPIQSHVKYDKCFTVNSGIVDKKLSTLCTEALGEIKELFCSLI